MVFQGGLWLSGAPALLQGGLSRQPTADSTLVWVHREQRAWGQRQKEGDLSKVTEGVSYGSKTGHLSVPPSRHLLPWPYPFPGPGSPSSAPARAGAVLLSKSEAAVTGRAEGAGLKTLMCFNNNNYYYLTFIERLFYARLHANQSVYYPWIFPNSSVT